MVTDKEIIWSLDEAYHMNNLISRLVEWKSWEIERPHKNILPFCSLEYNIVDIDFSLPTKDSIIIFLSYKTSGPYFADNNTLIYFVKKSDQDYLTFWVQQWSGYILYYKNKVDFAGARLDIRILVKYEDKIEPIVLSSPISPYTITVPILKKLELNKNRKIVEKIILENIAKPKDFSSNTKAEEQLDDILNRIIKEC